MTTPTTVQVRLQIRADTAANWTSVNPILLTNELGLESDTKKFKIGNGTSAWVDLAYFPSIVSGGTVLGNLEIGTTGTLTFEGSTANGFETTLGVVDPTADRTILLPNQSGTVVVGGNASIVDADIAANAEIAVSKLADGAARQLLQTDAAGTGVEWTSNIDIPGTLDVTGAATFDGAVTVAGDLTVNGTTTTISTQNLLVEDKNIILGDVATPTDVTADGGGITLKGATDKTINWIDATDAWTSSERFSVPLGSASAPSLTFTGDPNTGLFSPGADQVAISTGGSGRLFVDASGNVGVGVSASAWGGSWKTIEFLNGHSFGSAGTQAAVGQNLFNNGSNWIYKTSAPASFYQLNAGEHIWYSAPFGTAGNSVSLLERLRITSAGLVGVGTSSVDRLFIASDSADNNLPCAVITKTVAGGVNSGLQVHTAGTDAGAGAYCFRVTAGNTYGSPTSEYLRVTAAGRVGIGTTSPAVRLHVSGSDTVNAAFTGATKGIRFDFDGTQSTIYGVDNTLFGSYQPLKIGGSYTSFASNGNEIARFDTSGRLLVGTSTTSAAPLTVNGTIEANSSLYRAVFGNGYVDGDSQVLTGSNGAEVQIQAATSNRLPVLSIGGAMGSSEGLGAITFFNSGNTDGKRCRAAIYAVQEGATSNEQGARLLFSVTRDGQASPTEAMRIVSSGAFKFSTSGSYLNAANTANEFTQSNDNDGLVVRATSGTYINDVVQIRASRNTTNGTFYALSYYNDGAGAYRLRIADSGNVLNTNNSYGALSDFKLKENIVDATSQWSDIKALQVRKYNFKEETGQQTHTQIGLVAQEVELVSPGLVTESPDRDAEGNDLGTTTKSVNYSVLYMKAVKALQEAMERIETLEAKVAALETP